MPRTLNSTPKKGDGRQPDELESAETDNELGDPIESFRIGWAQVMRGEVLAEEEFWKAVRVPASSKRAGQDAS